MGVSTAPGATQFTQQLVASKLPEEPSSSRCVSANPLQRSSKRKLSGATWLRTHPLPQVVLTASKLNNGLLRQKSL
jgi:hypothetical protein